ncbi:unnamed protein product [Pleuronectes platessa]|uniref:Uncharacterized protein n=1 Tax=Pleuronectes platessa TaxID=8262 RepID=A0A9N7UWJ7_PLEPL|nr:unnamed protein product [Pleuronectes platessa]
MKGMRSAEGRGGGREKKKRRGEKELERETGRTGGQEPVKKKKKQSGQIRFGAEAADVIGVVVTNCHGSYSPAVLSSSPLKCQASSVLRHRFALLCLHWPILLLHTLSVVQFVLVLLLTQAASEMTLSELPTLSMTPPEARERRVPPTGAVAEVIRETGPTRVQSRCHRPPYPVPSNRSPPSAAPTDTAPRPTRRKAPHRGRAPPPLKKRRGVPHTEPPAAW